MKMMVEGRIKDELVSVSDYEYALNNQLEKETPTIYEWRYYDGFNLLSRINQDEKEITYQYREVDCVTHSGVETDRETGKNEFVLLG